MSHALWNTHPTQADGARAEVDLEIAPPRRVRLDVGKLPDHVDLALVAEQYEEPVDEDWLKDATDGVVEVLVPADGPVHLRVDDGMSEDLSGHALSRVVEIPAAHLEPNGAPFPVPAIGQVAVRARFVDEKGAAVKASALVQVRPPHERADWGHAKETLALRIPPIHRGALWVLPDDPRLAARRIPLPQPLEEGGVLDLGDVVFAPRPSPRLRVLGTDGEAAQVELRIVRAEHRCRVKWSDLDEEGAVVERWGPEPAIGEGAHVLVLDSTRRRKATVVPWRTTLEGRAPWTIAPPKGQLEIRVSDAAGESLWYEPTVHVDGHLVADPPMAGSEVYRVTGLAAGPHDVVIQAPDLRGQHHRVVLRAGETREVLVTLRE